MRDRILCVYHDRDLDGWVSANIVKRAYSDENTTNKLYELTLIGYDYGNPVPKELFSFDHIVLVDVSFNIGTMIKLNEIYGDNFTFIDHHISKIRELEENGINPKGLRDKSYAACELAWQYFFPDEYIPEAVRLLGRYDCFGHKGTSEEEEVLKFQYYARSIASGVDTVPEFWLEQDYDGINNNIVEGEIIYDYLKNMAKQDFKRRFTVIFDGYLFACINYMRFNPINFGINYHEYNVTDDVTEDVVDMYYDGFACFWYGNGKWNWSLYNDNGAVDCSEICFKRGGGGHKGAAGFTEDVLFSNCIVK